MRAIHTRTTVMLSLALAACSDQAQNKPPETKVVAPEPPPPAASAPAPKAVAPMDTAAALPIPAESTKVFAERCSLCHGKGGMGDGFGGKGMKPPPRSFVDATWQGSVTDEHIKTTLLKGGASVGKSPTMPPSPDLEGKTAVIDGLVRIVRSFKGATRPNQ